jgi:hypothetical protein
VNQAIIVRPTSHTDVREYHIKGETISELPYAEFSRPLWSDAESRFTELGPKGQAIAEKLMSPDREDEIERITFRPRSVRVYRAPSTSWGKLEWNVIVPAIKDSLDDSDVTVMQYEQFQREQQLVRV